MYLYLIVLVICLYITFFTYMKLKFPFWSKQPVYHFHNIHYFFKNDTYILNDVSQMNAYKYIDLSNITILPFKTEDCYNNNKFLIESYFSLIRNHYLQDKTCVFKPSNNYIKSSLLNHDNGFSYIALYTKSQPLYDTLKHNGKEYNTDGSNTYNTLTKVSFKKQIISGLTSKIIILHRNNKPTHLQNLYIHYVDFLCTHSNFRKQQITPKVIYTYAQQIMNKQNNKCKNIQQNNNVYTISKTNETPIINSADRTIIFMFKREAEKQSFVPYTVYSNFVFELKYFISKRHSTDDDTNITNLKYHEYNFDYINESNYEILFRTFDYIKTHISHFLHIPFSVIKSYITYNILHIFVVHKQNQPHAVYVFKNNCFFVSGKSVYECISSIYFNDSLFQQELFTYFFKESIEYLIKNKDIGYVNIENLSRNKIIIQHMRSIRHELYKYTNNFYLYNYILNSTQSKDIFMII